MYTSHRTCIMHTDIKMYNIVKLFNSQYFLRQRIFATSKYLVEFKHLQKKQSTITQTDKTKYRSTTIKF